MFARRRFLFPFYLRRRSGIDFFSLFNSFVLLFHSAFASPPDRWQYIEEVGPAGRLGQYTEFGYECGNDFFSDSHINDALLTYNQYTNQNLQSPLAYHAPPAHPYVQQYPNPPQELPDPLEVDDLDLSKYIDLDEIYFSLQNNIPQEHQNAQQHITPKIYHGPLYGDSRSSKYILWPIQKERMISSSTIHSSDPYYIVIKENTGEFIDVISRIKNNHYTRCIRIDSSRTELSTLAPEINTVYQCAHDFLDDKFIQKSLDLLRSNIEIYKKYLAPYVGRLYPAAGGYETWPIFFGDGLNDNNPVEAHPYFLVIDRQTNLIGVVVEGLSGNFLRCTQSRKISEILPSDALSHSSEPKLVLISQPGYYCGRAFFHEDAVQEAVNAAKRTRPGAFQKFPAEYHGPPDFKSSLLWPLFRDGHVFVRGTPGIFRVVLTTNFEIKGVAIMQKKLHMCELDMMIKKIDHEKSDFYCIDHVLTNDRLEEFAEFGCSYFEKSMDKLFPAKYKGPNFDKSGPYFTFPVSMNFEFVKRPGRDRVVINSKCEVVGAITIPPNRKTRGPDKRFVLCVKPQDVTNGKTYILPEQPITEHEYVYI